MLLKTQQRFSHKMPESSNYTPSPNFKDTGMKRRREEEEENVAGSHNKKPKQQKRPFAQPLTCDVCGKDHPEWEKEDQGVPNNKVVLEGAYTETTQGTDIVHVCCLGVEDANKRFPGKRFEEITVHDAIGKYRMQTCNIM